MDSSSGFYQFIVEASSVKFFLFATVGLLVALGTGWGAWSMLVRKRVMQDTPTALLRSAPQGYVELQGQAQMMDGEPIYAQLSLRPCVWFRYKIERKERNTHGRSQTTRWRVTNSGTSDDLFFLVDPTGRCAVDPEGAKVTTAHRDTWYGNSPSPTRHDPPQGFEKFSGLAQFGKQYRYTEERIEPGDPLYALGNFTTHGGAGTSFDLKTEVGEVLREWKKNSATMLDRFDADGDGEIDMAEWEQARVAAEREVVASREQVTSAPPIDVLGRGSGGRKPFILTNQTEQDMLKTYHWSSVGLFFVSASLFTVASWAITIRIA